MKEEIKFGSIDVNTGECMSGEIKDGKMVFKKEPFWKRWFRKTPVKTEYVCTAMFSEQYIWSDVEFTKRVPVYRDYNALTGKTIRMYAKADGRKYYVCHEAYERDGVIVGL